jgi:hypothetical protein
MDRTATHPVGPTTQSLLTMDWCSLLRSRACAVAIAVLSCLSLMAYVFYLAPYEQFMFNDMLGYWNRAMERLQGQSFRETQFMAWPPIYHIYLAEFFRVCRWLGLNSLIRLETVLVMNILLYSVSVYAVHRMAVRWFEQSGAWAVATTAVYALGFPAWYFNAFLLSDNFSAPLLVVAIALLYCRKSWQALIAAAAIFAIAAAARPSIAPYGLAFVIALLVRHQFTWTFISRAAVFSGVFFLLILCAMAEVSRISNGKVRGLSANGGLDFFIANSRYYRVDTNYDGWHNFVIVPALSWKPEQGAFRSTVPYYQQDYYFDLGWQHLKHDPARLLKNVEHVKHLFFTDMFPTRFDAPGFKFFRPLWDKFKFVLFLSTVLYIWLWPSLSKSQRPLAALLLSLIGITMVVSYLFTGEPRYTYSIIFAFYLLGFNALRLLLRSGAKMKRIVPQFAALLVALWGAGSATAYWLNPVGDARIKAVHTDAEHPDRTSTAQLPSLYFPFSKTLPLSSEHGDMQLRRSGMLKFETDMHVDRQVNRVLWEVFSSWPVKIFMNGEMIMNATGTDYFRAQVAMTSIEPGVHRVVVEMPYYPGDSGLAINYLFFDDNRWMYRQRLGIDRTPFHFSLPEPDSHDH